MVLICLAGREALRTTDLTVFGGLRGGVLTGLGLDGTVGLGFDGANGLGFDGLIILGFDGVVGLGFDVIRLGIDVITGLGFEVIDGLLTVDLIELGRLTFDGLLAGLIGLVLVDILIWLGLLLDLIGEVSSLAGLVL